MVALRSALVGLLLLSSVGSVSGLPLASGLLASSTDGGLTASGTWGNGNAAVFYEVSQRPDELWEYVYEFSSAVPILSRFFIEVEETFRVADALSVLSLGGWVLESFTKDASLSGPSILGFSFLGSSTLESVLILTERSPMWGSVAAINDGAGVFMHSDSFGLRSNAALFEPGPNGFLLVPGVGMTAPIPEPGIVALFFAGLLSLIFVRRSSRKPALS